jgi:hypothetical protein
MDNSKAADFIGKMWDDSIIPEIAEYIKVPNKSPHFDPDWEKHGHMETAVQMLEAWCKTVVHRHSRAVGRRRPAVRAL